MDAAENSQWKIERLGRHHDRAAFDCGQAALNDWLLHQAGQFDRKDLARTYVAVREGEPTIAGYYAILAHGVRYETLVTDQVKGLPRLDVPVVLLGRLAVDRKLQGQGLGLNLLLDALRRAEHIGKQIGVRAVEVDAIDDAAKQFYMKYGFMPLLDDPLHLLLPMHIIRKLNLPPL